MQDLKSPDLALTPDQGLFFVGLRWASVAVRL